MVEERSDDTTGSRHTNPRIPEGMPEQMAQRPVKWLGRGAVCDPSGIGGEADATGGVASLNPRLRAAIPPGWGFAQLPISARLIGLGISAFSPHGLECGDDQAGTGTPCFLRRDLKKSWTIASDPWRSSSATPNRNTSYPASLSLRSAAIMSA